MRGMPRAISGQAADADGAPVLECNARKPPDHPKAAQHHTVSVEGHGAQLISELPKMARQSVLALSGRQSATGSSKRLLHEPLPRSNGRSIQERNHSGFDR